ncbi:unnamed protein product [Sphacelaria rigidula]
MLWKWHKISDVSPFSPCFRISADRPSRFQQAYSNSVQMAASSNHLGIRGFRVRRGTTSSAALKNTSAKFVASKLTVSPGILWLSSLMMSWMSSFISVGVRNYYPSVDRSTPNGDSSTSGECEATKEPH